MTAVRIPGKVYFEFNKDDLPPGPPGATGGVLQNLYRASFGPVSISSTTMVPTGIKKTVEITSPRFLQIDFKSCGGHNVQGGAVQIFITRNGVVVPGLGGSAGEVFPVVGSAHGAARVSDAKDFRPLLATVFDQVEPGTYEYEVFALQTSGSPNSYGYIGRRGDPGFVHETLLLISELSTLS